MTYDFVQAANYTPANRTPGDILYIVWHDMEAPEVLTTAEATARYFANQVRSSQTGSSAHTCADADSVVQCVRFEDVAWSAPNVNRNGFHLENAGYRDQGADWRDEFSLATIRNNCQFILDHQDWLGHIPHRWLTDDELRAGGIPGHITHEQATRVLGPVGGHTDPGPDFPYDHVIACLTGTEEEFLVKPEDPDIIAKRVVAWLANPAYNSTGTVIQNNLQAAIAQLALDMWTLKNRVTPAADVDEKALALELAPLITSNVNRLSHEGLEEVAKAVADEQAKRLAPAPAAAT